MTGDRNQQILTSEKITSQMPHRYPFVLLDRIIKQSPGRCVAIKNVTINEWFFRGHFPEQPVMPGCLLAEAMAQAGNFIRPPNSQQKKVKIKEAFLLSSEVKFLKPVLPGDQLIIISQLINKSGDIVRFKSKAYVSHKMVASGKFMALIKEDIAL